MAICIEWVVSKYCIFNGGLTNKKVWDKVFRLSTKCQHQREHMYACTT